MHCGVVNEIPENNKPDRDSYVFVYVLCQNCLSSGVFSFEYLILLADEVNRKVLDTRENQNSRLVSLPSSLLLFFFYVFFSFLFPAQFFVWREHFLACKCCGLVRCEGRVSYCRVAEAQIVNTS